MAENTENKYKWQDKRDEFVNEVVELLEKGTIPWRKEWDSRNGNFIPKNPVTNTVYQSGNHIRLLVTSYLRGYDDDRFVTFLQAKEQGWKIKKGAKGTHIEKAMLYDKLKKEPFNSETTKNMSLEEKNDYMDKNTYYMVKNFVVFNAVDVEGIPPKEIKEVKKVNYNEIDDILKNSGVPIKYYGNRAYYSPKLDEIVLPTKESFDNEKTFYSTALHELAHSTGHSSRLNRSVSNTFGSKAYAKEELIAEMSAIFSGTKLSLGFDSSILDNSKAYLQGWAKTLKADKNLIFEVAKISENVSDYIVALRNKELKEEKKEELKEEKKEEVKEEIKEKVLFADLIIDYSYSEANLDIKKDTVYKGVEAFKVLEKLTIYEKAHEGEQKKTFINNIKVGSYQTNDIVIPLGSGQFGDFKNVVEALENRLNLYPNNAIKYASIIASKENETKENVEKFFKKTLKDIKTNMKPIKADYKIYVKTQRELAQKRENPLLKNNNLEKKHSLTR